MSGPNSKPEIGQQIYRTPTAFLKALRKRFDVELGWDLACSAHDCVGTLGGYEFPEIDALQEDWSVIARCLPEGHVAYVNPPFAQAKDFARKLAETEGLRALALVPVALGTNWWRRYVHNKAVVAGVGRLVFNNPDGRPVVGKDGKPQGINRDCALLAYRVLPPETPAYLLEPWKGWMPEPRRSRKK